MILRSRTGPGDFDDDFFYRASARASPAESPPTSPRRGDVGVDANGYTANLRELVDFLGTLQGVRMFKAAYRENMQFKVERYGRLAAEAEEEVDRQKDLLRLKTPDLKAAAGVDGDQDNWQIFETISQSYLDAKDRATAFDAVRERARARLEGSMQWEDLKPKDVAYDLRDGLVLALRNLANFSSQAHIIATVVDIVSAFIKNPRLIQTKFLNFMMVGAAGTGKTTLAAAIAKAFARAGMFVDDKVTDAGRAEFVGEYEGQTVARTRAFLVANLDRGVVFVDEAYAITPWSDGKPEGYGSEAATAMVEFMTRYKGLYCIFTAGYEKEMTRYFLPTNPGLTRRFPYRFVLQDLSPDDLLTVFKRTLLTEQGLEVPVGKGTPLESEAYFSADAWSYLRELVRLCTGGEVDYDEEEYDRGTRKTYRRVRRFQPNWPRLYTLFENQAGSMTNLAEEAVTLLMRTVTYKEAVAIHQKSKGIARASIRTQPQSTMRAIVVQRIVNSALSDADAFLYELEQLEAIMTGWE